MSDPPHGEVHSKMVCPYGAKHVKVARVGDLHDGLEPSLEVLVEDQMSALGVEAEGWRLCLGSIAPMQQSVRRIQYPWRHQLVHRQVST